MEEGLNRDELQRYLARIGDRWALERALLGGARMADSRGAPAQRERGPEYVVVLVSEAFDGMPWLERVHQAGSLWDGLEMGAPVDVHCYTPPEFERRLQSLPAVRRAATEGYDLIGGESVGHGVPPGTRVTDPGRLAAAPSRWQDFEAGLS